MVRLDSLDIALDVLFFAMFGVALLRFLRQPDALHRDVLAVFASFAGLFLITLVLRVWPEAPRALTVVWILLLFLQPPLTLRVAGHFRRPPRWLLPLAFAWMVVSLGFALMTDVSRGVGLPVAIGYLVVIDLVGAREFGLAASTRVGTARLRLASSAVATALFALALLLVGIAAGGRALGATLDGADQLARLLAVLAVLGYLAAFLPPERLLLGVQRAIAFGWLDFDQPGRRRVGVRHVGGAGGGGALHQRRPERAGPGRRHHRGQCWRARGRDTPRRTGHAGATDAVGHSFVNGRPWRRLMGRAGDRASWRVVRLSEEAGPGTGWCCYSRARPCSWKTTWRSSPSWATRQPAPGFGIRPSASGQRWSGS